MNNSPGHKISPPWRAIYFKSLLFFEGRLFMASWGMVDLFPYGMTSGLLIIL